MRVLNYIPDDIESFEIEPTEGFFVNRSYKDFETGLFVFVETPVAERHAAGQSCFNRLVDPSTGRVLSVEEWKEHIDYETIREELSEDGEIKYIRNRVHEPERHSDSYDYQLVRVATGEVLDEGSFIAFDEDPSFGPLEYYYEDLKQEKYGRESLELWDYPEDVYLAHLARLEPEQTVLEYVQVPEMIYFRLVYTGKAFELRSAQGAAFHEDIAPGEFSPVEVYPDIASFWEIFSAEGDWFEVYATSWNKHPCMEKFITTSANAIRKSGKFTQAGYELLSEWEDIIGDDTLHHGVLHQFCARCHKRVFFQSRYPKYICLECTELFTDKDGRPVNNIGYYRDTGERYEPEVYFIDGVEYDSRAARFGGTAFQLREKLIEATFPRSGYMRFRDPHLGPVLLQRERNDYKRHVNALAPGSFPGSDFSGSPPTCDCVHCGKLIVYYRQEKVLCEDCRPLLADRSGRKVRFEQIAFEGAVQGYYRDTGEFYNGRYCFLGNRQFEVYSNPFVHFAARG